MVSFSALLMAGAPATWTVRSPRVPPTVSVIRLARSLRWTSLASGDAVHEDLGGAAVLARERVRPAGRPPRDHLGDSRLAPEPLDEGGGVAGVGDQTVARDDREGGDRVGHAELVVHLLGSLRGVAGRVGVPGRLQTAEDPGAEHAGDDEPEDEEREGGSPTTHHEVSRDART